MKSAIYVGWIPTVSGNLSFNEIGNTRIFSRFAKLNEIDRSSGVQSIALFGKRELNDGVLHPSIRRIFGVETEYNFGFICYSESRNSQPRALLKGIVYFTDSQNVENILYEFVHGNIGDANRLEFAAESIRKNIKIIRWANVEIFRNGQCTVTFEDGSNEATDAVAQQFYFFLKDACHHHYHHDPKSDSITMAYKCNNQADASWRFETVYALHRSIVAARRYKSEERLRSAIGISSYARSFEKRFLTKTENGEALSKYIKDHGFEPYLFDEAISSLTVRIDEVKKGKSDLISNIGLFVTIFFAVTAICVGFSQLKAFEGIPLNRDMAHFASFSIAHPLGLSTAIATLGVCTQILILNGSPFAEAGFYLVKKSLGRLAFLPKTLLVLILLLVGVAFFAAAEKLFELLIQ
jgi:hypothetical protein